jgi:uncharacterized membrane protein YkvI
MKKIFGLCCTFVGTVIGAGFATGREISLYFGNCSIVSVFAAGFFLGFFCYVFMRLGAINSDIFGAFGKCSKPVKIFVYASNIAVYCATLAGSETVFYNLFSIHGGSAISGLAVLAINVVGSKSVKILNMIGVPVIAILAALVFFRADSVPLYGKTSFVLPLCYASMNLVTGGFFLGKLSYGATKKECAACSAMSGAILTALLFFVYCCVKGCNGEMPFIEKAASVNLAVAGNVILYISMLTTLAGTLGIFTIGNKYSGIYITAFGLLVSCFGFQRLVDNVYPVIGAVGGAIVISATVILCFRTKFSRYYNRLSR